MVQLNELYERDLATQEQYLQYELEPRKRTWKGVLWDTLDKPKEERALLFKVDAIILSLASIGFFVKVLDQTNINSAYLSGMEEDLNMYGNQLVHAVSIWTAGYVFGQIPATLLLTRVDPRWVLPTVELIWGALTLATFAVKNYTQLYAIRFFIGLCESNFYPGLNYLIGSWYTKDELAKRSMIFWIFGNAGTMFSGFLQAAAYNNLNGVNGLAGWRWLFIINGIMTMPIAILGYIFYPGIPLQSRKTWWLTDKEFALSRVRVSTSGTRGIEAWSWAKLRRILFSWHTYFLPLLYTIWMNGLIQQPMGYWLKSFNNTTNPPVSGTTFSVAQINELPNISQGIFIAVGLSWAWISDGPLKGLRWPFIYVGAVYGIIIASLLYKRDLYSNITGQKILYWFDQAGNASGPLILSWINEICKDDSEKRAILIGASLDFAYVVNAVAPNFVWKTTDFPQANKGFVWMIALNTLLIVWVTTILTIRYFEGRRAPPSVSSPTHEALTSAGDKDGPEEDA